MKKMLTLIIFTLPLMLWAQSMTVTGTVKDAGTGETLAGANVVVEGTNLGTASAYNGRFTINNVPDGLDVTASMIGYESQTLTGGAMLEFSLAKGTIQFDALEVLASRATQKTPVAYSNINKEDMAMRLGSRDIPLALNTTPSVYATGQGGGAGDARVSVRGFNQRNVAIMINGVPVNDMENAWVYWSNWDGVGDATSSIQVQRGLSAVNLATPSIGGTMNVITDPAAKARGGSFKQELGQWGFLKSSLSYHTGIINDNMAFSGTVVKKTGTGYYGGTWTDAYAYYLGASYHLNDKNVFELFALGAPQRHGQNLYRQNIGTYSHSFAEGLDSYDVGAFDKYNDAGRDFNQNAAPVSSSYSGSQYFNEKDQGDRHESGELSERENFFHKPQISLNWYHNLNEDMNISSIFYYSGGYGGGTGTYGSIKRQPFDPSGTGAEEAWYAFAPWSWNWDEQIAENSSNVDSTYSNTLNRSTGILRNSNNRQWTLGAISKLNYTISENIKTIFGLDWRTAEILHVKTIRDMLGGDYYVSTDNSFDTTPESQMKVQGDAIDYNFTNTVNWLGFYGQGEYTAGPLSAFGMLGFTTIGYTFADHFHSTTGDATGDEVTAEATGLKGMQLKGGGTYSISEDLGIFANFGIVNKPPIFDYAINEEDGSVYKDPDAEKFQSMEAGGNFTLMDGMLAGKVNYYSTDWKDRFKVRGYTNLAGEDEYIYLKGMDAKHSGVEAEIACQPMDMFRLDAALSFGNWTMTDDVIGDYTYPLANGADTTVVERYYVKGLHVGDAPQTQMAFAFSLFPMPGLTAKMVYKYYDNHYADWSPFDRTDDSSEGIESWKTPAYGLVDLHAKYDLPINLGNTRIQAFLHVFNLLDEQYIQDAVDNSQYNSWDQDHDADDAEVFLGLPMNWNMGVTVNF